MKLHVFYMIPLQLGSAPYLPEVLLLCEITAYISCTGNPPPTKIVKILSSEVTQLKYFNGLTKQKDYSPCYIVYTGSLPR